MTPHYRDHTDDDLKALFQKALADGDTALADELAVEADRRDAAEGKPALLASALWYVEHGLHVFPLQPGGKIPFKGSAGCKDATTNPARVRTWWAAHPDANIGLATGHLVDVVDIDGAPGQKSRASDEHWETIFSRIEADNVGKVLTPRPGGMHIYVPATGDGNKAGIVPGVDYRGAGGYVVAPPSVIHPGGKDHPGHYRWLGTPTIATIAGKAAS